MSSPALECFFYHSVLADGQDAGCVSDIIRTARRFNAEHDITGVLVFDGEHFCQYLEGPAGPLGQLIGRLMMDPRHQGFMPLIHQPLQSPRRYAGWSMAFALLDDSAVLAPLLERDADTALGYLEEIQCKLDMA
ncbi:BLUF domain-containing protein [Corticibacter populi]|uniref:BLUF domain-containing protein n=1 Tax=Corticibacter populi TaxID=1550736 RepID=A0A3M6R080_9BURK|nr:BLUF domain-containing protein [Corticibacter populi]RMX08605.1 BLUF domain-containing protein [Corticibacter populi]RZS35933.1 FAD-dependent sensor of blue light [Corticibacter populi]